MQTVITSQDEIIGAIENIILENVEVIGRREARGLNSEMDSFQEIAQAFTRYCDGALNPRSYVESKLSKLMTSVKGANAVERVGDAIEEIGGQF